MSNYILEINNLRKNYKDFSLKDISFKMEKGYIMGFIGPNGAGKSTTIKLIMNLIKRDSGEVKIFGLENIQHEKTVKESIGFVYDDSNYFEHLTIDENKRIFAPFYQHWDDKTFYNFIRRFDLLKNKKIKDLSKGMKRKFSLAMALSHQAKLIIMDEPTSGLDPIFRNEILEILSEIIQDEEKGILFSTHITSDLDKIADYITFIHKGEIVLSTSNEAIMAKYAIVKGGKDLLDSDTRKEFISIKENSFGFEALTQDTERVRKMFQDSIVIERPTLEDIMLYTVRGSVNV